MTQADRMHFRTFCLVKIVMKACILYDSIPVTFSTSHNTEMKNRLVAVEGQAWMRGRE